MKSFFSQITYLGCVLKIFNGCQPGTLMLLYLFGVECDVVCKKLHPEIQ
jgi:hypothetical protein